MASKCVGKLRLDERKKFFTCVGGEALEQVAQRVVYAPSLAVLEARLDVALSSLVEGVLLHGKGIGIRQSPKSLPTPIIP